MIVCDAKQARECDARTIEKYHIPSLILMEHAALQCVREIQPYTHQKLCIVSGSGNNGADGLAMARLLYRQGVHPVVFLAGQSMSADQQTQYDICIAMGMELCTDLREGLQAIRNSEVIVDCLFGNGLNRDVQGEPATIIQTINETDATVISIDIASGLDATTGRIRQAAVQADVTLALDCIKKGSLVAQGPQVSGDIRCLDIGIVHEEKDGIPVLDQSWARAHLPARSPFSHKGTFGKALLVGGSQSMPGALSMAARACYAAGIGTLTLMVPDVIADLIAQKIDFAMRLVAPSQEGGFAGSAVDLLKEHLAPYDLIAIGNGMGRTAVTEEMVKAVLKSDKPVLLDADAFWAIRNQPHLLKRKAVTMLSPHVKECSYVLNQETKSIQNDVIEAAKEFSALYPDVTLLLKSSISVLSQGQQQCLLHRPNSALAKGGSGDILCGLIAGMYGQSRDAYRSMALAAYIHACCAETKKDPAVAGPDDFIDRINTVIQSLREVK